MFSIFGVAHAVPGLARHRSLVNDAGEILAMLPAGLHPEERADTLAALLLRHAAARLDPRDFLLLLGRAFRRPPPSPARCTPESVAAWIPGEVR